MGDKVLISSVWRSVSSETKTFLSPGRGEEFCLIIKDNVDANQVISRVKKSLSIDYNNDIKITISAGVASKGRNENFTSALIYADEALYRAKREGRDCIVFADNGTIQR